MTVFDFTESEVGSYGEVVMSVIVSPLVKPGERLPKSPYSPSLVGTTTHAARDHAIERWHLPHWMEALDITIEPTPGRMAAKVGVSGEPVAELTIADHSWQPVSHLYQSFMKDDTGAYLASITMEGSQSEHEEEVGQITLHEHAFNASLVLSDIYERPFRELWMRDGVQTFDPLVQLQPV
jgi:hypothetical protein